MAAYAVYIFVNVDLKMRPGKIAAQVGHAVQQLCEMKSLSPNWKRWKREGAAKIVVKASQKDLEELSILPNMISVVDAGLTQVREGSTTAVACLPILRESLDGKYFKAFALL